MRGVIDFLGDRTIQLWLFIDLKYFKAYKFGWSHLKKLSKLLQNLMNFDCEKALEENSLTLFSAAFASALQSVQCYHGIEIPMQSIMSLLSSVLAAKFKL